MLPRAIDDAPKAFTDVLNRFSKEITELTKAKIMSSCKRALHGRAANHIDELFVVHIPFVCV